MDERFSDYKHLDGIQEYFDVDEQKAFYIFFKEVGTKSNKYKKLIKTFINNDNLYVVYMNTSNQIITCELCDKKQKAFKQHYYENYPSVFDTYDNSWRIEYTFYIFYKEIKSLTERL